MSIFSMDASDIEKIQQKIIDFGEGAEEVLNNYLMNEANAMFNSAIVNLIPVSDRNKKHAKYSDPIKGEQDRTLELYMHSKKAYNYLYFPQTATGVRFLGKAPNDFMGKGVEAEMDNVVNGMLDVLIKSFD